MTDTDFCIICLKHENCLKNVVENDAESERILLQLNNLVPEVNWKLRFKLCQLCTDGINKSYNFKQLCLKSYESWKDILVVKVEENCSEKLVLDSDTENFAVENDVNLSDANEYVECFQCKMTFETKILLKKHIAVVHSKKEKAVTCEFCEKTYSNRAALRKHQRICKKNLKVQNTKESGSIEDVKKESVEHASNCNTVPPACSQCGTTFCNKYLLKRHLQNVHATEKRFKCDLCERSFVSAVYLNAHKRYHTGDRTHICSFCGKGFITASDLYHHEKIHANKRAYRCEICPKAFNTSSDLHKHKICVHLDRSEWKYVCTYCQRRFPLKTNLDTHVKTHTGEKNYACHLCERKCINKSVLSRHIETHSNVIAFKCEMCMQGYKYRKSLDVHMAKVHGIGDVVIPERVKRFFCHLCPKSYFANNKLQKHIRAHSGERPFQCPHCEKGFVDKSYIKQHLKSVHDVSKLEDL